MTPLLSHYELFNPRSLALPGNAKSEVLPPESITLNQHPYR
ncbi:hypothetical protein [Laspinema palackyanum]